MSCKKLIAFIILINYFQIKVLCFIDTNSVQKNVAMSSVVFKNVTAKSNYKLTWANFIKANETALLVVSLPPQLRHRHQLGLHTSHRVEVVNGSASLRIRGASRMHQGFYTAYRVINDSNHLYVVEYKHFYLNIEGLAKHSEECNENTDCESNHCIDNRCICSKDRPVPNDRKCHSAQPIGSKCLHSSQCQFIGGHNSMCGLKTGNGVKESDVCQSSSSHCKCRCVENSFAIEIPFSAKYCVEPKFMNTNCSYSEECQVIGPNRYCGPDFTCQCIPNHFYETGQGCKPMNTGVSNRLSSYVWPLIAITFAAKYQIQ